MTDYLLMPRIRRILPLLVGIVLVSAACDGDGTEPSESAPFPSAHEQGKVNCFLAAVVRTTDQGRLARALGAQNETLAAIAEELFASEVFKQSFTEDEFNVLHEGCVAGLNLAGVRRQLPQDPPSKLILNVLHQSCKNEILGGARSNPDEYFRFTANALDAESAHPHDVAEAFVLKILSEARRSPIARVPRSELVDACATGYTQAVDALDQ